MIEEKKNLEEIKAEMLDMYEVPEEQLEKDVLNSYSVGNVKNNIYGVLKARVESMSNYNKLKPIDNIIIDELISTI